MQLNEVKSLMRGKTIVDYEGSRYYISGCIMRLMNGEWYYQLELSSLNSKISSVVIVDMQKVSVVTMS